MDLKEAEITNFNISTRHPWELARFEFVFDLLKRNIPNISSDSCTVLDIGCGDTFFVEKLAGKLEKSKFIAVDTAFSESLISKYKKRFIDHDLNIELHPSLEKAMEKNNTPVDIVLLLDVMEHIENDGEFLKYTSSFHQITSKTIFIITVPAFQSLFCSHDVFLGHFRRYNNKLVSETLTRAGMEVLSTGYFFSLLLLPRSLQVLKEKMFTSKTQQGLPAWKSNRLKDKIFYSLLVFDFRFTNLLRKIGIKLPGLSNYALCRKSV